MNSTASTFPNAVQVIQLYRKQVRFGKEDKKTFDLKAFWASDLVQANSAFVENGELFLPESMQDQKGFAQFDLMVLVHDILSDKPSECHFFQTNSAIPLEIFKIRGKDPLELHLDWSYFSVGDPSRSEMKVCDLVPEKAYEIRINGKTDFSLTGRRPRHYLEQVFVVEHLGMFRGCTWFSELELRSTKKLPENRKLIDLRKPLW